MVSLESVRDDLAEGAGRILILMQEGDTEAGFTVNEEWADEMYQAWEHVHWARQALDRAILAE